MMTANKLSTIAAPLRDRCAVFRLPEVTPQVAGQMFDAVARGVPGLDPDVLEMARRSVLAAAERGGMSLRRIKRILEQLDDEPAALLH
jgi:DNA polymerase III delta prime subunit